MKKYIVFNWKANPKTLVQAKRLFGAAKEAAAKAKHIEIIICPPFPYIPFLKSFGNLKLGGQNCHWQGGPFTGEVSPEMLEGLGCEYVILGHSERRRVFKETDKIINKKVLAGLKTGLKVLLFLGEQKPMSLDRGFKEIRKQFKIGLTGVRDNQLSDLILVYEPAFAISASGGKPLLPKDVKKRVIFLRSLLVEKFGQKGKRVKILYGGSVDNKDAIGFVGQGGVEGVVVGRMSLNSKVFSKIIISIGKIK